MSLVLSTISCSRCLCESPGVPTGFAKPGKVESQAPIDSRMRPSRMWRIRLAASATAGW
jgi:hypothetical protein